MLGDFDRAWSLILEFIQHAALSKNGEVSLAALKTLQEIMYHNSEANSVANKTTSKSAANGDQLQEKEEKQEENKKSSHDKSKTHDDEIWNVTIFHLIPVIKTKDKELNFCFFFFVFL